MNFDVYTNFVFGSGQQIGKKNCVFSIICHVESDRNETKNVIQQFLVNGILVNETK
jgi:hypothetical protein